MITPQIISSSSTFPGLIPMVVMVMNFIAHPAGLTGQGLDATLEIDDWGIYFRIGEAF
jgi:hypothetical protein